MPKPYLREHATKRADGTTRTAAYWRATWTDAEGQRHNVSLGNADEVSEKEANRRLIDAMSAARKPLAAHVTVGDWTQECIDRLDLAPGTIAQYTVARKQALECWGNHKRLRDVTTADIARLSAYIRDHPIGQSKEHKARLKRVSDFTVRNRLLSLSAMFRRATKHPSRAKPYLPFNPFDDFEMPTPEGGDATEYVTVEEGLALIEAAPDANWRAMIALTRFMALRLEEAFAVAPEHIDHGRRSITVKLRENRRGKGRSTKQAERKVPMSVAAYALVSARLRELHKGEPLLIDARPFNAGAQGKPGVIMRRFRLKALPTRPVGRPFHDLRMSQADDWSLLHGTEKSAKWCGHGLEVARKHYRKKGDDDLGLVTGIDDPRARLRKAYEDLDRVVTAW